MKGRDIIDSRDLIEHFETLKDEFVEAHNEWAELQELENIDDWADVIEELPHQLIIDFEEIQSLSDFINELEDNGIIYNEEILINEDYFTEYCKELLKDIGYIADDFPTWIEIDYEATVENIKGDYAVFEWDNLIYYAR